MEQNIDYVRLRLPYDYMAVQKYPDVDISSYEEELQELSTFIYSDLAINKETKEVIGRSLIVRAAIVELWVDDDYKDSGIGEELINRAMKSGIGAVIIFGQEPKLEEFYRKNGFKDYDEVTVLDVPEKK